METLELVLFILALLFLPSMLARMAGRDDVPDPVTVIRWLLPRVRWTWPFLQLAGYLVKRLVCFAWSPLPDEMPALLRCGYVEPEEDEPLEPVNNDVAPTATTSLLTIAMPQNDNNDLLLLQGKAYALAVLVRAKKVNQTEGIYLVFGEKPSSTNGRYLRARALLQEQLELCENPFPNLTADGRPVASELQR